MAQKKKLVVLSGAGISAESGLATFRDSGGLWEGYKIEDVATPEAWSRNQELVLEFYNERRKNALAAKPNQGHLILAELEKCFEVTIITQNVDNLHEQAGSTNVLHLHGELFKSRSTIDGKLVYPIEGWELKKGDLCQRGYQLRPHIVWFGEAVPMMDQAIAIASTADIFIVVGTSLQVYPAAGLLEYAPKAAVKYCVDPNLPVISNFTNGTCINERASVGMKIVQENLMQHL